MAAPTHDCPRCGHAMHPTRHVEYRGRLVEYGMRARYCSADCLLDHREECKARAVHRRRVPRPFGDVRRVIEP